MKVICENCLEDSLRLKLLKRRPGFAYLFNEKGDKCFICEDVKEKVADFKNVEKVII